MNGLVSSFSSSSSVCCLVMVAKRGSYVGKSYSLNEARICFILHTLALISFSARYCKRTSLAVRNLQATGFTLNSGGKVSVALLRREWKSQGGWREWKSYRAWLKTTRSLPYQGYYKMTIHNTSLVCSRSLATVTKHSRSANLWISTIDI